MAARGKTKPRRRLDAETARKLILDATEARLVRVGPAGIRLQEVAADAGVSHPTVLHHFGSRELLVKAACSRAFQELNASLVESIMSSAGDEVRLEAMLENVATALAKAGHARVVMWLALEGFRIDDAENGLSNVVDATHALRLARHTRGKKPTREDTAHTVVLATLALVGGAVLGTTLLDNAGLPSSDRAMSEFHKWLFRVLIEHLDA